MIDLNKVDLKNIPTFRQDIVLHRCVEEYFFGEAYRNHPIIPDFSDKFAECDFIEESKSSYIREWFNKFRDRIWLGGNYYMSINMEFYTSKHSYSFVLHPWEETLYLLKHIDDFKLDLVRALKIVELNQRINVLEQKEDKR